MAFPTDEEFPPPHVAIGREGEVATATLVNPARRNAITVGMWRELEAFALAVGADSDVRCVIVRGEGGVFSAGADIAGFAEERSGAEGARAYDDQLELACRAVEAIRQPTVAVLEGPVVGAGAALALSCDIRVASEDVFFMVPAARLGLGYDPRGVARLARILGESTARWLLLTAGRLPVQRGLPHGRCPRDPRRRRPRRSRRPPCRAPLGECPAHPLGRQDGAARDYRGRRACAARGGVAHGRCRRHQRRLRRRPRRIRREAPATLRGGR